MFNEMGKIGMLKKQKCIFKKEAFTMIELMIVLVMMGLTMAIVIPKFFTGGSAIYSVARINITETEMMQIHKAIMGDRANGFEGFFDHMRRIPSDTEGLAVLCDSAGLDAGSPATYNPMTETGWNGPYMSFGDTDNNGLADSLEDAWGNAYHYDDDPITPRLWSNGPDENDNNGAADDIVILIGAL